MNPLRIWLSRPPVVHLVLCTGALIAFLLLTLVAGGFPPRTWQSFGQALAALPHLARGQGVVGPALWSLLLGIQALCLLAAWGLLAFLFVQQGYALVEVTRRGRAPGGATRPPLIVSDYRAEDAQSETERMAAVLSEEERDAAASASTNMARAEPANPYDTERLDERVPGASLHTPPLFFPQEAVPNTSDLFGQASPHAHPSRDEERVSPKPLLLPGVQEEEARRPQPQPDGAATNQQEERPTPAPPQTGEGERTRISPQERLETAFRDLLARDIPLEKITIDMLHAAYKLLCVPHLE